MPSLSMGKRRPPRSIRGQTSACCAPSTAARTGAFSTIFISRAPRYLTWRFKMGSCALPHSAAASSPSSNQPAPPSPFVPSTTLRLESSATDRKSTRLNSSHRCISYAVFCLKKQYHSVFKGQGGNVDEGRKYQPGDEVRTRDGNVTAFFKNPAAKKFLQPLPLPRLLLG